MFCIPSTNKIIAKNRRIQRLTDIFFLSFNKSVENLWGTGQVKNIKVVIPTQVGIDCKYEIMTWGLWSSVYAKTSTTG
jgi:hypothetical protein